MNQKSKKTILKKLKSKLLFFIKLVIPFYVIRIKKILTTGKDIEKLPPPTKGYGRIYFFEPDENGNFWMRHHEIPLYLGDKFNEDFNNKNGKLMGLKREEVVRWVLENKN
jgi:hypothetical protein